MLQPRRVAARASAQRIADENGWQLGNEVGYHIRFEKRYNNHTRIRIFTEAILTRILLDDPYLDGISCVILDEFHERNIHTDLALAFLREIQQTIRPDLKLLVMSATLDAQPLAQFLHNAPILEVEGRTFPIHIHYRPPKDTRLDDHLPKIIEEALNHEGDLLVFLPGRGEIERAARTIENRKLKIENILLPLHGSLTAEDQQKALRPDPQNRRKIILATNIAETSLTIDGVRTVIDTGLARIASFDPDRGMDRLDLQRISQASANQRAGRAGRQGPGRALRLWPELEQKHLPDFTPPEVHRVDLSSTLLAVHAWGAKNAKNFPWFESPSEDRLTAAENLLSLLGALQNGALTNLGRTMLRLPTHPRLARLLLAAKQTPLEPEALNLATILSDDTRTPGDLLQRAERLPPHLSRNRDQLASIIRTLPPMNNEQSTMNNPTDLLLLAYPDRLAKRREGSDPHAAVMVGKVGIRLTPEALTPALARADLFLALDPHHDPRNKKAEATVRTAIPISEESLQRLFPQHLHTETDLEYDPQKEKVIAITRDYFHDLILYEDPHGKLDPTRAAETLATALLPRARELFLQNDPAARLIARITIARHYAPDPAWPTLDDPQLHQLLHDACTNKRALAELTESHALEHALRSTLPYPLDRQLDQLAPETITVPTGNKIKIDYPPPPTPTSPPPTPILPVRLQELFGLLETPRIANNRLPLLLHLLSPGYKPIQITQDHKSFWSSAYFEVRKDLRTRYPKHKWPENPLTATPESKGRPRR